MRLYTRATPSARKVNTVIDAMPISEGVELIGGYVCAMHSDISAMHNRAGRYGRGTR
jgi:hypothetical protein